MTSALTFGIILVHLFSAALGVLLGGFILHLSVNILGVKRNKKKPKLKTAFTIMLIIGVVSLIFNLLSYVSVAFSVIGFVICVLLLILLIMGYYGVKTGRAIVIALVMMGLNVLLNLLLVFLATLFFLSLTL